MTFISLFTILERKEYLAKMNNLPNHPRAGPPEARGPMQLHQLRAGPVCQLEFFIKNHQLTIWLSESALASASEFRKYTADQKFDW